MNAMLPLNHQEYQLSQELFVSVFDSLYKSVVSSGDKEELIGWFSDIVTEIKTHKLLVPKAVQHYTSFLFQHELLRDFVLELTENFVAEVICVGPDGYKRLVNTLSLGVGESKAVEKQNVNRPEAPAIAAIHVTSDEAHERFLANPWLVTLMLLIRNFKRTELGLLAVK